jgi:hypothetical protein
MSFTLTIEFNAVAYVFLVEQEKTDQSFEYFKLSGGGKVVRLRSNRPMLKAKGLKRKPVDWRVIEGEITFQNVLDKVIQLMEKQLNGEVEKSVTPKASPPARMLFRNKADRKTNGGLGKTLGEK